MLKKIYFFLILCNYCAAQVGGESVFSFLNTTGSAQQVALGGETLTIYNNTNQASWNPAIITSDLNKQLAINYTNYLDDISFGALAYAHQFKKLRNPLHLSVNYINNGTFIKADENGNENGSFKANDIAIAIGHSYNIPNSNYYVGANIRFIHSTIENYTATGLSSDLAILYNNTNNPYKVTLVARNIGTQLSSYNETREQLPFELVLGGSYQLENVPLLFHATFSDLQRWKIGVENPSNSTTDLEGNTTLEKVSFFDNMFRHISAGAELFPNRTLSLRLGYNFRRAAELKLQNTRSFAGLSFGFGLKIKRFKLNYAYSKYHSATNVSSFSLLIDLMKNRKTTEKLKEEELEEPIED